MITLFKIPGEAKAGGLRVQSHLSYITRPCFKKRGKKKNPASPSDLSYFNFPRDSLPSYILCSLLNSRNSSSASCLARLEVCATMLAPTSFVMFDFTTMFWEFRVRNYGKMNSYVILKFRECLLNLEKKSSVTCLKSV
jgi:hypothetical protein